MMGKIFASIVGAATVGAIAYFATRKRSPLVLLKKDTSADYAGEPQPTRPGLPMPHMDKAQKSSPSAREILNTTWRPTFPSGDQTEEEALLLPWGPSTVGLIPLAGFTKFGWTEADKEALIGMATRLGYNWNACAMVLNSESKLNPRELLEQEVKGKDGKTSWFYAAGLCQLTRGANLPGFQNNRAIRNFAALPIIQQLEVVEKLWARFPKNVSNPGRLYLLNFLPAVWSWPLSTTLGRLGDKKPLVPGAPSLNRIYEQNPGFDPGKKGFFTIRDVFLILARNTRLALPVDRIAAGNA